MLSIYFLFLPYCISVYLLFLFALTYCISKDFRCSTVLKRNGEKGHLCLVPELRGKALSFLTIKCDVSCTILGAEGLK